MPRTRLNQSGRDALGQLARKLVSCPAEQVAADDAYKATSALVRKMVEIRFPPKDMAVLKRYDVARPDGCLRMNLVPGGFQVWKLRQDDKPPLQPTNGCHTYAPDEATSIAVTKSVMADANLAKAKEKKLADYYALIQSATSFEAVLEVWPEAEEARSSCGAAQLTVAISSDVVARIRADIATRQKAA